MCRGSSAIARCFLEGLANKVRIEGWSADMARGKLFLSGNRLFKHDIQLGIELCQDLLTGASYGVGPESVNRRT